MSALFYKNIVAAKNGSLIPEFNSGRAAHSKYNPEREGDLFLQDKSGLLFALVIGAGGGYQIQSLAKRNPNCKILVIEKSAADLEYLRQKIPCVQELFKNKSIVFSSSDEPGQIESALFENYFPAHHGDLTIAALRPWAEEAGELYKNILARIEETTKKIAADFSTQARFGGLWQKNIFCNLKILKKLKNRQPIKIDTKKIAAVIAAGPSLDKSIQKIEKAREKYFVVATDTAHKILCRRKIAADAIVSIDAQFLSAEHFNAPICKDAIFVLDLAGNHSIANFANQFGGKILFANLGHPLTSFISLYCKRPFVRLSSGGGTVTIAALDFAKKCGFSKVEIFGADFGYSSGKAYARGSYLDDLYRVKESRVQNSQSEFTKLMFRSPLKKKPDGILQSQLLLSYQQSLEEFLRGAKWKKEDSIYECEFSDFEPKGQSIFASEENKLDFDKLRQGMKEALDIAEKSEGLLPQSALLLPSMAYYEGKNSQNKISPKEAKNLALNKILLYNAML